MSETDRRNRRLRQRLAAVLICLAVLGVAEVAKSHLTVNETHNQAVVQAD